MPARLKRAIAMVVDANGLPRTPSNDEVFDRSFLPPRGDRASKLEGATVDLQLENKVAVITGPAGRWAER